MRTTLILLLVTAVTHLGFSQTGSLHGRVIDARTLKPLPFSTVYLNQTTIGTITGTDGEFDLKLIPAGRHELVVSYVGYQPYQSAVVIKEGPPSAITIGLIPGKTELKEVLVKGKKDKKWTTTLEKFSSYFFGVSPYSEQCRIVNPWALDFTEDALGNITATASLPLQIENAGLGYTITCQLKECIVGPAVYKIYGAYRFEEAQTMDTTLSALWHQRRTDVYLGSTRHLLKSIVENGAKKAGYQLYVDRSKLPEVVRNSSFITNLDILEPLDLSDKIVPSETEGLYTIPLSTRTEVHYMKDEAQAKVYRGVLVPVSWLEVAGGSIEVNAAGVVANPKRLTVAGAMADAHIAELLPVDFHVTEDEAAVVKAPKPHSKLAALMEKPYIMTDKPYYYAGDAIMFKSFFNYISPVYRDSLSHVMNVELIDKTGSIIRKKLLPLFNGVAVGDLALHVDTKPGDYTLRAYTNWMMNFDKQIIFHKPIKVLPPDRLGVVREIPPHTKQLSIVTEKEEFEPREEIALTIEASDFYGDPIAADLAISVSDIEQAAIPESEIDILTHYPFTKDMLPDTSLTEAKHLIQYGIDFKGKMVVGKKNKPSGGVMTVYQDDVDDVFTITTDEAGHFHQQLQLMDSTELYVDPKTYKGRKAKIIAEEVVYPAPPVEVADTLMLDTYRPADASKYHTVDPFSTAKMLEEVTIKAKKIQDNSGETSGMIADTFLDRDRLLATNATDLLTALRGMVPGLRVMYFADPVGGVRKIVCFSGMISLHGISEALVLVDDIPIGTGLDNDTAADKLATMTVQEVEHVGILRFGMAAVYGARGANGVIVIKTKRGEPTKGPRKLDRKMFQVFSFKGYSKVKEFAAPDYSVHTTGDERLDLRSTIYWNPYMIANGKDPLKVTFYAADISTRYRIVVEGVTADGEPVRGEKIIVVRSKK